MRTFLQNRVLGLIRQILNFQHCVVLRALLPFFPTAILVLSWSPKPSALDFSTSSRQGKKLNHFPDPFFSSKNNLSFILQDASFYPPTCVVKPEWTDQAVAENLTRFVCAKYNDQKADQNHGICKTKFQNIAGIIHSLLKQK